MEETEFCGLPENCTCCFQKGEYRVKSSRRGIGPLLELLESGESFAGFSAADKVVGRAGAFLYCLLGVRSLYARVLSRGALEILSRQGIACRYDTLAECILDRSGRGLCPMEQAVAACSEPQQALLAIRRKIQSLQQSAD